MFKSIFAKYMLMICVPIIIGFIVLSLIMGSMIVNYSIDAKNSLMHQTADITQSVVTGLMSDLHLSYSETINRHNSYLNKSLEKLSELSESLIILTDDEGNIIFSKFYGGSDGLLRNKIDKKILEEFSNSKSTYRYSTLGGLFSVKYINYCYPLYDMKRNTVGRILICSESTGISGIVTQTNQTFLISGIWVFLAAMMAVYFISVRIVEPIKKISTAAKSFSKGRFDARVPVTGSDEIGELAEAFNNMAASLMETEQSRRQFLANVSHDLRTPMTSIQGFIDGIIHGTIPEEKHLYYLDIISGEVRRLSRLVNSLLDISRLQAGEKKFKMSVFDVCETARLILISFEEKIEKKNLNVDFMCDDESSFVYADKDAIHQVIYNLCDNAIKFVDDNGDLKIKILKKDKKYNIYVYNSGKGISSKDSQKIFERFFKGDPSRGLDKSGAGLGLYIVKTIIDSHEEKITVTSREGEYCEFCFTLTPAPTLNDGKKSAENGIKK